MDSAQLMGALIASWEIARKVYVEKVYSKAGTVVGLNPLDPSKITKQRRANGDPYYQWRSGNQRVDFKPEDLLIREAAWHDVSPLAACLGSVEADSMQTAYVRAFFGNAGVPSGVLTSDQELGPEQAEEVRLRWRNRLGLRFGGAGDVAVLGNGTTYQKMGSFLNELENDPLRRMTETRILMTFGVPPIVVYSYAGLDASTYSNIKSAFRQWWDTTLTPFFNGWREWLTWSLLANYESEDAIYAGTVALRWNLDAVFALHEDQDAREIRAERAFKSGGLSRAEYRAQLGQEPTEADRFYVLPLAVQIISEGTTPDAPALTDSKTAPGPAAIKRIKAASTLQGRQQFQAATQSYLAADYQAAADYVRRQADE